MKEMKPVFYFAKNYFQIIFLSKLSPPQRPSLPQFPNAAKHTNLTFARPAYLP
jgi:hypothetical protein